MICLLIRHGRTPGNERGVYLGKSIDEGLSDSGREAANRCDLYDEMLRGKKYRLFSSPMLRAVETSKLLFGVKAKVIEEFVEIDFGDFEGKNHEELDGNEDYQRWIDSGGVVAFPNGESMKDFAIRTLQGFHKVVDGTARDEIAVVVCHGGTIMSLLNSLTGENYFDFQVKNLEGYRLEFRTDDGKISDISYNRISSRSDT